MKAYGFANEAKGAPVRWMSAAALAVLFAALWLTASGVKAQSLGDKFGGFSTTSNEPINIEADQLNVNDVKKTAVFSGNVKAVQGNFELRSKSLEVFYVGGAANQSSSGKVKRLAAKGTVLITTTDSQSATSQWADFDVLKQTIVLGDQVVLTQGGNIIKGGGCSLI